MEFDEDEEQMPDEVYRQASLAKIKQFIAEDKQKDRLADLCKPVEPDPVPETLPRIFWALKWVAILVLGTVAAYFAIRFVKWAWYN